MSNKDDLDALVGSLRGRGGKTGRSQPGRDQPAQPAEPKGLNPLDVLALPPAQRELVNWLGRKKQARFSEIQQALAQDAQQVEQTLSALQAAGYVQLLLRDGEILYSVAFRGTVSRAGRGLGSDIWGVLGQDNVSFLEQTELFRGVPRPDLESLVNQLEERQYTRSQVIIWQGDAGESLYIIKQGFVEVTRLCPNGRVQKLDYVKPGEVLGEVSLITKQSCTATCTALSQVIVLQIKRPVMDEFLARHSSVAVELARVMGRRLANTTSRLARHDAGTSLSVLVGARRGAGCTTLGATLALALAPMGEGRVVYTEFPTPGQLPALLDLAQENGIYHHPGGYDVLVLQDDPGWPPNVRATLLLDKLRESYTYIVASLTEGIGDKTAYWLEQATQVIVVTPPDQTIGKVDEVLRTRLNPTASPDAASRFTVVNRTSPPGEAAANAEGAEGAEFVIPFLPNLPPLAELRLDNLPAPLAQTARALANRLGRTYWIGIYVPTTTSVNLPADTRICLDRTLAFMSHLFGGATSLQAQGVWGSKSADLVSESISIVRSYTTQRDLDQHLPAVIEYVESLKQELKQEAMAIEVNRRLMLI